MNEEIWAGGLGVQFIDQNGCLTYASYTSISQHLFLHHTHTQEEAKAWVNTHTQSEGLEAYTCNNMQYANSVKVILDLNWSPRREVKAGRIARKVMCVSF